MNDLISFILNGELTKVRVRPDTTVLDLLRNHIGLKGTKEGCAEGDCGACTVLLQRDHINGGRQCAANSCIMTAAQIDGAQITTVEGIGAAQDLSALQTAMAENGASQCGFCTPGIVVALTGLARNNQAPTEADIHDALAGNLCRCTGYKPIVEAVQKAISKRSTLDKKAMSGPHKSATIQINGCTAHQPKTLTELLVLRANIPNAKILAGGTDLGVARAAYETDWDDIILVSDVTELRAIQKTDHDWTFGAAVTWSEILDVIADELPSFATLIRRFGSTQIRSMGTIGGNIGTASPIGDGPPAMIALGAQISLAAPNGDVTTMPLDDFFVDYRKTKLPENGVIVSVTVPRPQAGNAFRTYKVSKRYDQDISTVCGAFDLKLNGDIIEDIRIAYGGMAAIPKRALNAEGALRGQAFTDEAVSAAMDALAHDFAPLSDWRGSAHYRMQVAAGLIKRLQADLAGQAVEVHAL